MTASLPAVADEARLEQLAATGLTDGHADEVFDKYARIAAVLLEAPVSFVSLVGLERQVMPGAAWLDQEPGERVLPIDASICSFSVATGDETVIEDVQADPLVRQNDLLEELGVRSYAGWPLTTDSGHVLGNLCVIDRVPRTWSEDELASLRDLASLVLEELRHRVTRGRLAALRDQAQALWNEVPDARDAVRLLVEEADRAEQATLQRAAATASARMDRVARAAGHLRPELAAVGDDLDVPERVDLARAVRRAAQGTGAATGNEISTRIEPAAEGVMVRCDPLALERALSQLLVSMLHHAATGQVTVDVAGGGDDSWVMEVRSGHGRMPLSHLSRAVARLDGAIHPADDDARRGAAVRVSGGVGTARAGSVEGTSSSHGVVVRAVFAV